MELQGKKVLVFGSGKSGIGASDLLAKVGAFPVIYDGNAETDKDAVVHKTDGTYPVTVYAGELPKEVQDSLDLVVLSPGVPTDLPLVKSFYEQGLPVWGEVELAYRVGDGEVLAITGTNGKTTTTALLGKSMQDESRQYRNPIYFQSTGDEAKFCNCCRDQQFSAGND